MPLLALLLLREPSEFTLRKLLDELTERSHQLLADTPRGAAGYREAPRLPASPLLYACASRLLHPAMSFRSRSIRSANSP